MKYLFARLSERTTWVGIAGFMTLMLGKFNPELETSIVTIGLAVVSVVSILMKD